MDHSELGGDLNGFRYKFVEPKEHKDVLRLLEENLFPSLTPIGYDSKYAEDWVELFTKLLNRESSYMSFVAIDIASGEVAAIRIIDLVDKNASSDLKVPIPPFFKHKSNKDIAQLFFDACKDYNLFDKYGITQYADMFGVCVDKKFRQKGLASEMYRRGLNVLQRKGIEIAKVMFISPYSRKAGQKYGYEEFTRVYFHESKDAAGNILNPSSHRTDFTCFGVFDLRNRKIQE